MTTCNVQKTLLYVMAGFNILVALNLLGALGAGILYTDDMEANVHNITGDANVTRDNETSTEHGDAELAGTSDLPFLLKLTLFVIVTAPALANLSLAAVLIIGLYKRCPALVRLFKRFILAQMLVICVLAVGMFVFLWNEESRNMITVTWVFFIALFGAEAWTATSYHKQLLEEVRLEVADQTVEML